MKSVLQKKRRCLFCGSTAVECHHVFEGAHRSASDRYGLTVYLCRKHHMLVHADEALNRRLKSEAQEKAMKVYGFSEKEWLDIFRRNWR